MTLSDESSEEKLVIRFALEGRGVEGQVGRGRPPWTRIFCGDFEAKHQNLVAGLSGHADCGSAWSREGAPFPPAP